MRDYHSNLVSCSGKFGTINWAGDSFAYRNSINDTVDLRRSNFANFCFHIKQGITILSTVSEKHYC